MTTGIAGVWIICAILIFGYGYIALKIARLPY